MGYKKRLLKASFRGVSFDVEEIGLDTGRKIEEHEFPKNDKIYNEEISQKPRIFEITAFITGNNYDIQSDKLLEACEKKGAGKLIHPRYGALKVICSGCVLQDTGNRFCYFSLTFVEKQENKFPEKIADNKTKFIESFDHAIKMEQEIFEKNFNINNTPNFVQESVAEALNKFENEVKLSADFDITEYGLSKLTQAKDISEKAKNIVSKLKRGFKNLQNFSIGDDIPVLTKNRINQHKQLKTLQSYLNNIAVFYEGKYLNGIL